MSGARQKGSKPSLRGGNVGITFCVWCQLWFPLATEVATTWMVIMTKLYCVGWGKIPLIYMS